MIALFQPPTVDRAADVQELLHFAETTIDDELATAVQIRLAGVATRLALEFHLHDLCRVHGPPKGQRWHNFAIRLMKCGEFTMDQYRHVRRLARLAAKAVHGKPFGRKRARVLLEAVREFIER